MKTRTASFARASRLGLVLAALAGLAVATAYMVRPANATQPDPLHQVTICHRTDSETNPYVIITVDEASVDGNNGNDNGQGDHLLEHTGAVWAGPDTPKEPKWGDIIPPFYSDGSTPTGYPSLNWDAAGQAIFENGCNPVESPSEEQSVAASASEAESASVVESAEQSVEASGQESAGASAGQSGEQSVEAGTGTPAGSISNGAMGLSGPSPLPTIAFSLLLLASLGALAYANVKSLHKLR